MFFKFSLRTAIVSVALRWSARAFHSLGAAAGKGLITHGAGLCSLGFDVPMMPFVKGAESSPPARCRFAVTMLMTHISLPSSSFQGYGATTLW